MGLAGGAAAVAGLSALGAEYAGVTPAFPRGGRHRGQEPRTVRVLVAARGQVPPGDPGLHRGRERESQQGRNLDR